MSFYFVSYCDIWWLLCVGQPWVRSYSLTPPLRWHGGVEPFGTLPAALVLMATPVVSMEDSLVLNLWKDLMERKQASVS